MLSDGKPIADAPRDGTVILVEIMSYSGVPETGGYAFEKMQWSKPYGRKPFQSEGWHPVGEPNCTYGEESFLRWFPGDTDPATLTLTTRTNWNFIPSNGTCGDIFYSEWCERCIHERPIREDYERAVAMGKGCDIYMRSMAFKISDPQYPTEWTYKTPEGVKGEPRCTAFELDTGEVEPSTPRREPRCKHTLDLFGERP